MDATVDKRGAKPVRERQNGIDRAVEILDALLRLRAPAKIGDLAKRIGAPRSTLYSIVNRLDRGRHPRNGRATRARSISARRCISMAAPMPTPIRCTGAAAKHSSGLPRRPTRRRSCARCAATNMWSSMCATVPACSRSPPTSASRCRSRGRLRAACCSITCRQATSCDSCPRKISACPTAACVDADAFVADIARARADGCCMTNGLSDRFTCCLAAPVRDRRGVAVATLCFIVPVDSSEARKQELLGAARVGGRRALGPLNAAAG